VKQVEDLVHEHLGWEGQAINPGDH
jgi:hypothetical protein